MLHQNWNNFRSFDLGHESEKIAVAESLIKNEAYINVKGRNDYTPLHFAAEFGNEKIVKFLANEKSSFKKKLNCFRLTFAFNMP